MFHKLFVHLHIRVKEKLQNVPRSETDFLLNFDMFSSAFTCVNGSTIQLVLSEFQLRINLWLSEQKFSRNNLSVYCSFTTLAQETVKTGYSLFLN